MSTPPVHDQREARFRALADPTRRHLLRLLDDANDPLSTEELAGRVGLHTNTVRGHLGRLEEAGLIERLTEARDRPGRPRILYRPTPRDVRSPGTEGYRFLAEVLASSLQAAVGDAAGRAEEAGRAWGRFLVDRPAPYAPMPAHRILEVVDQVLLQLGFQPERQPEQERRTVIRLHDCPFRDIAQTRSEVVCSVHLGLLRGMTEELGGAVSVDELRPFVEPSLCLVELSSEALS